MTTTDGGGRCFARLTLRLRRNKWTLLNACVSGTASDEASRAEVSGFLKAFIAAGAGALTVTLWPVLNDNIVEVARRLLQEAARAAKRAEAVDIVAKLHDFEREAYARLAKDRSIPDLATRDGEPSERHAKEMSGRSDGASAPWAPFHACPMVLYL